MLYFWLKALRDSKFRVAKSQRITVKKFQSRLSTCFSGIVHFNALTNSIQVEIIPTWNALLTREDMLSASNFPQIFRLFSEVTEIKSKLMRTNIIHLLFHATCNSDP